MSARDLVLISPVALPRVPGRGPSSLVFGQRRETRDFFSTRARVGQDPGAAAIAAVSRQQWIDWLSGARADVAAGARPRPMPSGAPPSDLIDAVETVLDQAADQQRQAVAARVLAGRQALGGVSSAVLVDAERQWGSWLARADVELTSARLLPPLPTVFLPSDLVVRVLAMLDRAVTSPVTNDFEKADAIAKKQAVVVSLISADDLASLFPQGVVPPSVPTAPPAGQPGQAPGQGPAPASPASALSTIRAAATPRNLAIAGGAAFLIYLLTRST